MRKKLIIVLFSFFVSVTFFADKVRCADSIDYKIGYEIIPGKFYSPQYKSQFQGYTDWSGSPAWSVASSTPGTYEKNVGFSILFLKMSRNRQITPNFSAGFETGIGIHMGGFSNEWGIPGGVSTNTVITAEYPESPTWTYYPNDNYSWFYKKEMNIFFIPVLGKIAYEWKLEKTKPRVELGAGAYLIGIKTSYSYGKKYVKDTGVWEKGDIVIDSSYDTVLSPFGFVVPTIQFASSIDYEIADGIHMTFVVGAGWLSTKSKYDESTVRIGSNKGNVKDGFELGGVSYNVAIGVKFPFRSFGRKQSYNSGVGLSKREVIALKKKLWKKAVVQYNKGNYDKAISYWEKILDIDPNHKPSLRKIEQARKQKRELWGE
ncbi:MAG: hypothetical protein J7L54_02510 [Elusimicrobia bacterium]|nr:hypothetical protein [Elusimicrobiota bacterium]